MPDVFSRAKRSEVMSHIRGKGNKSTELKLLKLFRDHHIKGWRRHQPLIGKPDFVFQKKRLAIFVDGCFWHACPQHFRMPSSNREFWEKKISSNTQRDRIVSRQLKREGWTVIRFWEHDMKGGRGFNLKIRRLKKILEKGSPA